jgi:hypothetical protein
MKKMMLFLLVVLIVPSYGQNNATNYKENRDLIISLKFKNKIGESIKVETNNRNKDRNIVLEYLIVSINTNDTIINEFNQKTLKKINKRIYSEEDLNNINDYIFVNAHFIDNKTKKPYQTTYSFNHANSIKRVGFEICYKIKNISGKKRRLNYLHITTY